MNRSSVNKPPKKTIMEQLANLEHRIANPVNYSKSQERAAKGLEWVETEISKLVKVMQGMANKAGVVTFGALFEAYTEISDTLVGTLLRAKKRGLLHWDGHNMLFQGAHDHVEIKLFSNAAGSTPSTDNKKKKKKTLKRRESTGEQLSASSSKRVVLQESAKYALPVAPAKPEALKRVMLQERAAKPPFTVAPTSVAPTPRAAVAPIIPPKSEKLKAKVRHRREASFKIKSLKAKFETATE